MEITPINQSGKRIDMKYSAKVLFKANLDKIKEAINTADITPVEKSFMEYIIDTFQTLKATLKLKRTMEFNLNSPSIPKYLNSNQSYAMRVFQNDFFEGGLCLGTGIKPRNNAFTEADLTKELLKHMKLDKPDIIELNP